MLTKYLTFLQGQQPSSGGALLGTGASEVQMPGSPESSNGGNGNDMDNEATRTMIMNLLEADAGLATIAIFLNLLNKSFICLEGKDSSSGRIWFCFAPSSNSLILFILDPCKAF